MLLGFPSQMWKPRVREVKKFDPGRKSGLGPKSGSSPSLVFSAVFAILWKITVFVIITDWSERSCAYTFKTHPFFFLSIALLRNSVYVSTIQFTHSHV